MDRAKPSSLIPKRMHNTSVIGRSGFLEKKAMPLQVMPHPVTPQLIRIKVIRLKRICDLSLTISAFLSLIFIKNGMVVFK